MSQNDWVIQMADQAKGMANDPTEMKRRDQCRSIHKLPSRFTNPKKTAYSPLVVSFGPYHCVDENVKPMEEHKDRALFRSLMRSKVPLEYYFHSLAEVVQDLKDAYGWLDPELQSNTDAFLRIMVRDGCFMLEILRFFTHDIRGNLNPEDPIFSSHGMLHVIPLIKRDMLLLENQLPILVLHKLLQVQKRLAKEDERLVEELVFKFFFPGTSDNAPKNCLHILDMYRSCLLGFTIAPRMKDIINEGDDNIILERDDSIIRSAKELHEAGIKIKVSQTRSLRDIKFDNGVLRLPIIFVDETTESLFLNLIAFERSHVGAVNAVTAYVFFMGNIIRDSRDITFLHSRRIIQNSFGSHEDAAKLFNSLSKDVTLQSTRRMRSVYKKLNKYCKELWWRSHLANLKYTYFTNPWTSLSVMAAIFLFSLTITQTTYTILSYHKRGE